MSRSRSGPRRGWKVLLAALLAIGVLVSLRVGGEAEIDIATDLPGIGPRTLVTVLVREPRRGSARVAVDLIQGERTTRLAEREFEPLAAWELWRGRKDAERLEIPVGSRVTEGLEGGTATLRVLAWRAGTWLRSPEPSTRELELEVRLTPPSIAVLSSQHYPAQGGSEAVVYRLSEGAARHGVEAGGAFFPGYELPGGGAGVQFALFAVPYDLTDASAIHLVAADSVGNRSERAFVDRLRIATPRRDTINVGDSFIERVAPEIEAHSQGLDSSLPLVERYVAINSTLRVANRQAIADLAKESEQSFLWEGSFMPLPNGKVMARFADHRTYLYGGEEVDRQDHLGYDLASVQHAPVPAANSGVVVMAQFLGIYGNVVVIDHGYGLSSLYGHLSSFEVGRGDRVERGQTIGRTGATGLAGGDHLHFGIFLHGVATDPVEWLDADWIRHRVQAKLALPAGAP